MNRVYAARRDRCGAVLRARDGAGGARPAAPLIERESTWRAEVVPGFDEPAPDPDAVLRAVRRVPGVTGAGTRDGARWLRVWGDRRAIARTVRAGGEVGARLVPASEGRVPVAGADEKGRLGRVGAALWRTAGAYDIELESDGASAVACGCAPG